MAFEDRSSNESNDNSMDTLEEKDIFIEEIIELKICLEEAKLVEDTLKKQIIEKEEHNEKMECEIVSLRKEIEIENNINLRFDKGSETLYEIIKFHCPPLIKTSLGYSEETSKTVDYSTETRSYLNVTKIINQQNSILQQKNKGPNTSKVSSDQFNQKENTTRRYYNPTNFHFNGQYFACHNFGHEVSQCVSYKSIMTSLEAIKQNNEIGIKKYSYNSFSPLQYEIECSFSINFGIKNLNAREKDIQHFKMRKCQQHLRYGRTRRSN